MERKKKAGLIFVVCTAIISSVVSWFFTMVGSGFTGGIFRWSMLAWSIWGLSWGGIYGIFTGYLLVKTLIKKRSVSSGIFYGAGAGLVIGGVNGFLTKTLFFGIIEGLILGPLAGLILSTIFLGIYRD